jgi:hypothetical protein
VQALARLLAGAASLFVTGYGVTGSERRQALVGVAGLLAFVATVTVATPRWWQWTLAIALAGVPFGVVAASTGGRTFGVLTVALAVGGVLAGAVYLLAEPCHVPCARRFDFAVLSPVPALVFAAGAVLGRLLRNAPRPL